MKRTALLLCVLGLFFTACGSEQATVVVSQEPADVVVDEPVAGEPDTDVPAAPAPAAVEADTVVLIWSEDGGCAMAGPNCARYVVTADGTIATYRQNFGNWVEAGVGTLVGGELAQWMQVAQTIDYESLKSRLGPGELTAAFDGVDFTIDAPFVGHVISSVDYDFDDEEAYFTAARNLAIAAADSSPLEIEYR